MVKSVMVQRTKEFILVTTYLKYHLNIMDQNQEFVYLPPDINAKALGEFIFLKLSQSRILEWEEFNEINQIDKIKMIVEKMETEMKRLFGYKNKKAIYKEMDFMTIRMGDSISLSPLHQDRMNGYTAILTKDREQLQFHYPVTISAEALGEATLKALEYCTSIYKK